METELARAGSELPMAFTISEDFPSFYCAQSGLLAKNHLSILSLGGATTVKGQALFKYLAFLISLFAIILVLPTTGEVFAQAPTQNQPPPPNQAPTGTTLDKLSVDVQALGQQIK